MTVVSYFLTQLLAAYTVLVEPILRTNFYRLLKKQRDTYPGARILFYRTQILWELSWVVVIAVILIPIPKPLEWIGLTLPNQVGWLITGALLLGIVLSVYLLRRNPSAMESMQRSLQASSLFLPSTPAERKWFAAAAITAGICEELLYRGFLIRYMFSTFPGLNWVILAVISGIIYGLSRAYQGFRGISSAAITGFSFAIVYVLSGSLIPAMAFHALADLRNLWLWQPEEEKKKKGR